jgi:predicted dehydrogenase
MHTPAIDPACKSQQDSKRSCRMDNKNPLIQALQSVVQRDDAGHPVAARLISSFPRQSSQADIELSRLLSAGLEWLRSEPESIAAHGDSQSGPLTALLVCRNGSCLVACSAASDDPVAPSQCELFGNRGVLAWDTGNLPTEQTSEATGSSPGKHQEKLLAALRSALASRQFVRPESGVRRQEAGVPSPESGGGSEEMRIERASRPAQTPPFGVLLVAGDYTHQPGYAGAFAADPRCRLIGLTDEQDVSAERKERNATLAGRLGIPLLPDLHDAICRPDVHIASICAEPERRARIIINAARARKHLYLDKPLCASVTEADAIVREIRQTGVVAQMMTMLHWEPARRAARIVESGQLGDIQAVHCGLCFAKGTPGTADVCRPRRESMNPDRFELDDAKRELTNIGVYCVAMLLRLIGKRVRRVAAATGNFYFAEHQRRNMEDFGQILLEFSGNTTATITAGRTGWRSHPAGGLDRIALIGTRKTAMLDAHRPRWEFWCDTQPWAAPQRDPDDPMGMWIPAPDSPYRPRPKTNWLPDWTPSWTSDITPFLDCIEQGQDCLFPIELAAAATEILTAAYRSAAERAWVALPLPR